MYSSLFVTNNKETLICTRYKYIDTTLLLSNTMIVNAIMKLFHIQSLGGYWAMSMILSTCRDIMDIHLLVGVTCLCSRSSHTIVSRVPQKWPSRSLQFRNVPPAHNSILVSFIIDSTAYSLPLLWSFVLDIA